MALPAAMIDLMIFQRRRKQSEIHHARRLGKMQAIGGSQAGVAIGTLHELVTESGSPVRSVRRRPAIEFSNASAAHPRHEFPSQKCC